MRRKKNEEDNLDINLSPLLDMVFILLIFFIVTTTFTRETGVDIKKPTARSASSIKEKIIKVAITREGTIHLFERQVSGSELETLLKREKARSPEVKVVILADSQAETQKLVEVIDKANLAGIEETSIAALN